VLRDQRVPVQYEIIVVLHDEKFVGDSDELIP
jgi:hypothetical protein